MNPGKHNIYDFFHYSKESGQALLTSAKERRARPIWKVLNGQGKRTGMINIPMTFPPDSVSGFMISGFPFGDATTGYTYPADLEPKLGLYPLDPFGEGLRPGLEELLLKRFKLGFERQAAVAKDLLDDEEWDLFWVVFTGTDKVQHFYWKFADPSLPGHDPLLAETLGSAIRDFWLRVDVVLGELIKIAGPSTDIFVVSDHGFSPIVKELRLENWLRGEGYVRFVDGATTPVVDAYAPGPFAGLVRVNRKGRDHAGIVETKKNTIGFAKRFAASSKSSAIPTLAIRSSSAFTIVKSSFTDLILKMHPTSSSSRRRPGSSREADQDCRACRSTQLQLLRIPSSRGSAVRRWTAHSHNSERGRFSILDVTPTLLWILDATMPSDLDGHVMENLVGQNRLSARPPRIGDEVIVDATQSIGISEEGREALEGLGYIK